MSASQATRSDTGAAWVVILAGVCAALHVAKLPPAIPALQHELGISLVEAGFLLSMVQLAGMGLGVLLQRVRAVLPRAAGALIGGAGLALLLARI